MADSSGGRKLVFHAVRARQEGFEARGAEQPDNDITVYFGLSTRLNQDVTAKLHRREFCHRESTLAIRRLAARSWPGCSSRHREWVCVADECAT